MIDQEYGLAAAGSGESLRITCTPRFTKSGGTVVMLNEAGLTVRLKTAEAVPAGWLESVTWKVKLKEPLAPGVPLMTPVALFRTRPAGSDPLTAQV